MRRITYKFLRFICKRSSNRDQLNAVFEHAFELQEEPRKVGIASSKCARVDTTRPMKVQNYNKQILSGKVWDMRANYNANDYESRW